MVLYLSVYEKTKIIGIRATQIANGSTIMIDTKLICPIKIANEELEQGKCPLILIRDGEEEEIHLNQEIRFLN